MKCMCGKEFESNNKLRSHKGKCSVWKEYKKYNIDKIIKL